MTRFPFPLSASARPIRRKPSGFALVVTMVALILMAVLLLAFFSRALLNRQIAYSSTNLARTDVLARASLDYVVGEIRQEIADGSVRHDGGVAGAQVIYRPIAASNSVPQKMGVTGPDTNVGIRTLAKVSSSNGRIRANGALASTIATTSAARDGRIITTNRWFGGSGPGMGSQTATPTWFYVTRGLGVTNAPQNVDDAKNRTSDQYVVGRFACTVYDTSGLLDANLAGYNLSSAATNFARNKGSAAYSDLTALDSGFDATKVNAFVDWRNGVTGANAGVFDEWASGITGTNATTPALLLARLAAASGHTLAAAGDNAFVSRKDLLASAGSGFGPSKAAAQYLTHFSRSVNAPTWMPVNVTNSTTPTAAAYGDWASLDGSTNRFLPDVRFSQSADVRHYKDDGTILPYRASETNYSYKVQPGDPLIQSRFSLARLAWLAEGDPTNPDKTIPADKAAAIKAVFGLVWDYPSVGAGQGTMANGGNKCWNYVGSGAGNTPQGSIKTLDVVAAEGREPNFFELLKAAILSGSIGKGPGEAAFNNGDNPAAGNWSFGYYFPWGDDELKKGPAGFYSHTFGPNSNVPAPARIPDMQIIRIGANIIDQYDADSWPTAIYFKYDGVDVNDPVSGSFANPIFGPVAMAYGIENLPYLQSLRQVLASPSRSSSGTPGLGTDLDTNVFAGWRQPYLWNPHQPPNRPLQNRPNTYQIRAYGVSSQTYWEWSGEARVFAGKDYANGHSFPVDYLESNSNTETNDIAIINFTLANPTSESAFCFHELPLPLIENGLSGVTVDTTDDNLGKPIMAFYNEAMPYPSPFNVPNHFAGFATGMTSTADPGIGSPYRPFYVSDMVDPNNASRGGGFSARAKPEIGANTYVLGWLDGSGRFHPYSYLTGLFTYEGFKLDLLNQRVGTANPNRGAETWTLPDPRTERFSLGRGIQAGFWETITVYRENNQSWAPSARPRLEEGFIGQGVPWQVYSFQWGHTMVNSQTDPVHTNYYRDPDGVVRPGDGFYGTPATGDGMMTFITPGSGSSVPGDTGNDSRSKHGRHPIILDRPFRSVAELGYVFRDQPFKTLDFFTDRSADAALLDVFSINGSTMTVQANGIRTAAAGRINPGAAPARAIEAMLKGGGKKEFVPAYNFGSSLTPNDATAIASQFVTSNSPDKIDSYPALVAALTQAVQTAPTGAAGVPAADKANKAYLEGSIRALAGSANLRTWNLTIDVVAQTGRVASSAQNLGDFIVEGERRMWLHVAIDRYTGEVVARQLEPVYE